MTVMANERSLDQMVKELPAAQLRCVILWNSCWRGGDEGNVIRLNLIGKARSRTCANNTLRSNFSTR